MDATQDPIWLLMFFPDGTRLISVSGTETRIWDVNDGKLLERGCNPTP